MNLDELRSVQSRERATDSLQDLRESFYEEAADYVQGLREEREELVAEAADPFSSPEVARVTDEIEMAEQVVEAIYERRVGKIVKQASLAAAGMAGDEDGLTPEERALYDDLVERIAENKQTVLDVLAGEAEADQSDDSSDATPTTATGATGDAGAAGTGAGPGTGATDRADAGTTATGGTADAGDDTGAGTRDRPTDEAREVAAADDDASPPDRDDRTQRDDGPAPSAERGTENADGGPDGRTDGGDASPAVDRTTVRITRDVGEILGVDEQVYRLESEDVVALPEANAAPLLDREAAEKLDAADAS